MGIKTKNIDFALSLNDILILKGFAICGMLCLHLFFCPNPLNIEFSSFTRYVGLIGDFCVSAFLFASGYGLTITFSKLEKNREVSNKDTFIFIIKRILKFYFNYWPIFIFAIIVGVFIFDIPINHGLPRNELKLLIFNFLGLSGHSSYNASWWFNTLILQLYLIFPILYYSIKKQPLLSFITLLLINSFNIDFFNVNAGIYLLIFGIGIILSMYGKNINNFFKDKPYFKNYAISVIFIIIPLFILPLKASPAIYATGIKWYAMFTLGISLLIGLFVNKIKILNIIFSFLGKHSANIYLIHTLLFYYWFPNFFYSIENPLIIFLLLISISLMFSILMEYIKDKIKYNKICNQILNKIE